MDHDDSSGGGNDKGDYMGMTMIKIGDHSDSDDNNDDKHKH